MASSSGGTPFRGDRGASGPRLAGGEAGRWRRLREEAALPMPVSDRSHVGSPAAQDSVPHRLASD